MEDGGSPPRRRTSILTVNMLRNENEPKFSRSDYQQTILETLAIGSPVVKVRAEDADQKAPHNVVTYELDHTFFGINQNDGTISVKRSLLGDGSEEYRVIIYIIIL